MHLHFDAAYSGYLTLNEQSFDNFVCHVHGDETVRLYNGDQLQNKICLYKTSSKHRSRSFNKVI